MRQHKTRARCSFWKPPPAPGKPAGIAFNLWDSLWSQSICWLLCPRITSQRSEMVSRRLGLKRSTVRVRVRILSSPTGQGPRTPWMLCLICTRLPGPPPKRGPHWPAPYHFHSSCLLPPPFFWSLPSLQASLHPATRLAFIRGRVPIPLCLKGCAWLRAWLSLWLSKGGSNSPSSGRSPLTFQSTATL